MENEIRQDVNEAKDSKRGAKWLFGEIFIISIVLGIYYSSWWIFGGTISDSLIALTQLSQLKFAIPEVPYKCCFRPWRSEVASPFQRAISSCE
ncbi:hypothetical protein [Paenibacillus algicola]|uniref:hypothetical protein n=1 Tax=Paenibacillus algicola TaxID=2565926 RepID=UPI0010FCFFEE|nr:hypothetical protein [Paenibacillus algicola]